MKMLVLNFRRGDGNGSWVQNAIWLHGEKNGDAVRFYERYYNLDFNHSYDLGSALSKSFCDASEICAERGMKIVSMNSVATECSLAITYLLDNR